MLNSDNLKESWYKSNYNTSSALIDTFTAVDFNDIDDKIQKFNNSFTLTSDYLEIKGMGIYPFKPIEILKKHWKFTHISALLNVHRYSKVYEVQQFDIDDTPHLVKIVYLDPYTEESYTIFKNSIGIAGTFESKRQEDYAIIKINRGEFWKDFIVLVQIMKPYDILLSEFIESSKGLKRYLKGEQILKIINSLLNTVNGMQKYHDTLKHGFSSDNVCISTDTNAVSLVYLESGFLNLNDMHATNFVLNSINKDKVRSSFFLVIINLLTIFEESEKIRNLSQNFFVESNESFELGLAVYETLKEELLSLKTKECFLIEKLLSFMIRDIDNIVEISKIINFFRKTDWEYYLTVNMKNMLSSKTIKEELCSVDTSTLWFKFYNKSEFFYILNDYDEGISALKSAMTIYKENAESIEANENISEIFILFSSYLLKFKDYKSHIHYMKEVIKIKDKQQDYFSVLLFKIQLYVMKLRYEENKQNQREILINIIRGIFHKFKNIYITDLVRLYIKENFPEDIYSKILDSDIPTHSSRQNQDVHFNNQQANLANLMEIYNNKNNVNQSLSILNTIDTKDITQVLHYSSVLFNSKLYLINNLSSLEEFWLDQALFSRLFICRSYITFINRFILHYFDIFEEVKLKALLSRSFDAIKEYKIIDNFNLFDLKFRNVFSRFLSNLLFINGFFKHLKFSGDYTENLLMLIYKHDKNTENGYVYGTIKLIISLYLDKNEKDKAKKFIDTIIMEHADLQDDAKHSENIKFIIKLRNTIK